MSKRRLASSLEVYWRNGDVEYTRSDMPQKLTILWINMAVRNPELKTGRGGTDELRDTLQLNSRRCRHLEQFGYGRRRGLVGKGGG